MSILRNRKNIIKMLQIIDLPLRQIILNNRSRSNICHQLVLVRTFCNHGNRLTCPWVWFIFRNIASFEFCISREYSAFTWRTYLVHSHWLNIHKNWSINIFADWFNEFAHLNLTLVSFFLFIFEFIYLLMF